MSVLQYREADGVITLTQSDPPLRWPAELVVYPAVVLGLVLTEVFALPPNVISFGVWLASVGLQVLRQHRANARGAPPVVLPVPRVMVLRPSATARHYREAGEAGTFTFDGETRSLSTISAVTLRQDGMRYTTHEGDRRTLVEREWIVLQLGDRTLPLPVDLAGEALDSLASRIAQEAGLVRTVSARVVRWFPVGLDLSGLGKDRGGYERLYAGPQPIGEWDWRRMVSTSLRLGLVLVVVPCLLVFGRSIATLRGSSVGEALAMVIAVWVVLDLGVEVLCRALEAKAALASLRDEHGLGPPEGGWATLGVRVGEQLPQE